jgi:hypothetical protein
MSLKAEIRSLNLGQRGFTQNWWVGVYFFKVYATAVAGEYLGFAGIIFEVTLEPS